MSYVFKFEWLMFKKNPKIKSALLVAMDMHLKYMLGGVTFKFYSFLRFSVCVSDKALASLSFIRVGWQQHQPLPFQLDQLPLLAVE